MSEEKDLENKGDLDEEFVFEDGEGYTEDKVKSLRQKLKECQKEKEEYLAGWQRCRADFVNAKRVSDAERDSWASVVAESFIRDILPVLDSFDLALAQKDDGSGSSWRSGLSGIYSKTLDILSGRGLKQVGKVGDKFDVREQESVAVTPVDKEELDDTVTEVLQKGYILNNKVIRPAKVAVGQYKL